MMDEALNQDVSVGLTKRLEVPGTGCGEFQPSVGKLYGVLVSYRTREEGSAYPVQPSDSFGFGDFVAFPHCNVLSLGRTNFWILRAIPMVLHFAATLS